MDRANLHTNANAASCRCGNALPHTHTREYYNGPGVPRPGKDVRRVNAQMTGQRQAGGQRGQGGQGRRAQQMRRALPGKLNPGVSTPGTAGGSMLGNSCHFPAPAPRRIYCAPAPFSQTGGMTHQLLVTAYGYSTPVTPVGL